MDRTIKQIFKGLIPVLLMVSNSVVASPVELNNAIQIYYAGLPHQAISLIKPLALSGDSDAQYLLGNILYSLSKTNKLDDAEDPVEWYKMAAVQGSPDANYALGVIFHNNWVKSQRQQDIAIAIFYYEKAVELGVEDAQAHLSSLKSRYTTSNKVQKTSKSSSSTGRTKPTNQMSVETGTAESGAVKSATIAKQAPVKNIEQESIVASLTDTPSQIPQGDREQGSFTVKLADVASQCKNYTRVGFNYYAESIIGALLVGSAKIDAIESPPSKPDTRLVKLTHQISDIEILLALDGVPKEVAAGLKPGRDFGISGIVGRSQKEGSTCDLMLTYQSTR
jgi:hypothetical protein